jgi:hypothetical protein
MLLKKQNHYRSCFYSDWSEQVPIKYGFGPVLDGFGSVLDSFGEHILPAP